MSPRGRLATSSAILVATLLLLQLRSTGEAIPVRKPLDTLPKSVGQWHGREATVFEVEILNILKVKDYLMRRYQDGDGRSLWLYIGYWDSQRKGAAPHSPKNCLPGSGWEPVAASLITIPLPAAGGSIIINRYLIQKDNDQQLVLYWYHSQGRAIAGEVAARIQMVKNSILRNRTDGALVRVSSPVVRSIAETEASLVKYVQALYPMLGEHLPN
jgi:EpsI family protein